MINIRPLNQHDLRKIHDLILQLTEAAPTTHVIRAEQMAQMLTSMKANPEMYLTLVADQAGEVAGMISLVFYQVWFHPGGTALITELIVDRHHRNQGIGAMLVAAAEKEARDRGMDEIEVGTETDNSGAQRFYRRCGFDETYVLLGREFE